MYIQCTHVLCCLVNVHDLIIMMTLIFKHLIPLISQMINHYVLLNTKESMLARNDINDCQLILHIVMTINIIGFVVLACVSA